jgi:hypothetical protein
MVLSLCDPLPAWAWDWVWDWVTQGPPKRHAWVTLGVELNKWFCLQQKFKNRGWGWRTERAYRRHRRDRTTSP